MDQDTTTTTSSGTITATPITISVGRTDFLDDSGSAKINAGASVFNYTSKTATSLVGCTVPSGSIVFSLAALVQRADHTYHTNLILLRNDTVFGPVFPVETVYSLNSYDGSSFTYAMASAIVSIYFYANGWATYMVKGLAADGDADKLFVGYQFTDNGDTYKIHSVKKSVSRNETEILALKIS
jgi:hypothetical protein